MPRTDPLAAFASAPEVSAAVLAAREEIDQLLWRRDVRAAAAAVAAASADRGARDSAALDGADLAAPDSSPMGRVLDAALRLNSAIPGQLDTFAVSPLQVFAHLHALVAHGFQPTTDLGRPRNSILADDPLHLGEVPTAEEAANRLTALARLLTRATDAPALVVAAVAHAEVAVARPFGWGSGLIARATVRLVLGSRGVDPSLFSIPEHGIFEMGRSSYVKALRGYASGTREGVVEWIVWQATAIALGARAVVVT